MMHLNAFLAGNGHHEGAWRLPESDPLASCGISYFVELARIAERGAFDAIFLADGPYLDDVDRGPTSIIEPVALLTAVACATTHIGLIASASTSYEAPYSLARRLTALDHISGGRAGWNVVTTPRIAAARNFGLDSLPPHDERYEKAAEFLDVALKLWDSWEDDTILADKASGTWGEIAKVHPAAHCGKYFSVAGALNIARSPQGYPVIVQAGSSEDGKNLAAAYAEAVFTAQNTLGDAQAFYNDLKRRTRALGRDVAILPGIMPLIGDTEAEAKRLAAELDELIVPKYAHQMLADKFGLPVESLPLDEQLPDNIRGEDEVQGAKSRYSLIVNLARREKLTVRQLIKRVGAGRGHISAVGSPEQVADIMETWYKNGAADGFNVLPAMLPSGLEAFVDHVVPILRSRGLFREGYSGSTLREHFGLPRPVNQYLTSRSALAGRLAAQQ